MSHTAIVALFSIWYADRIRSMFITYVYDVNRLAVKFGSYLMLNTNSFCSFSSITQSANRCKIDLWNGAFFTFFPMIALMQVTDGRQIKSLWLVLRLNDL